MLAFIIIFENRGAKVTSKTSLKHRKRAYFHMKSALHCKYIYASDVMYKTIQARVNTVAIPTTGKSCSLYTVCWIGVKVAVLCAWQYMPWNIFLIKVLNNVWYFEQPILTMIWSEAYLKHNWRNCLWKSKKVQLLKTISSIMLQICFWASPSWNLVFEISKII